MACHIHPYLTECACPAPSTGQDIMAGTMGESQDFAASVYPEIDDKILGPISPYKAPIAPMFIGEAGFKVMRTFTPFIISTSRGYYPEELALDLHERDVSYPERFALSPTTTQEFFGRSVKGKNRVGLSKPAREKRPESSQPNSKRSHNKALPQVELIDSETTESEGEDELSRLSRKQLTLKIKEIQNETQVAIRAIVDSITNTTAGARKISKQRPRRASGASEEEIAQMKPRKSRGHKRQRAEVETESSDDESVIEVMTKKTFGKRKRDFTESEESEIEAPKAKKPKTQKGEKGEQRQRRSVRSKRAVSYKV